MKKLALLLALMVATGTFKAYAQVVVEYRFDGNVSTPFYFNPILLSSAGNFTAASGVGTLSGGMYSTGPNNPPSSTNRARIGNGWSFAASPSVGAMDYFWFRLTPTTGYTITIDAVTFWQRISSTGPTFWQLRTSIAPGSILGTGSTTVATGPNPQPFGYCSVSAGLPTFSSAIDIMIYAAGASGMATGDGSGTLRIDTVRVYAHVESILPIELLSFNGEKVSEDVNLRWSTASEHNNNYFSIFRSTDLTSWQEIGRVPGAGTSQTRIDYQLVDEFPSVGTNYYKLRQTDFDGTFVDSDVVAVDVDVGETFVTFPNPVARGQPVQTSKKVDFIVDQTGRLVPFDPLSIIIEIPGVYALVHIDENGFSTTSRLIVNP